MASTDPTRIGEVRQVLGATVTVALDSDLAGTTPIYRGLLQRVGQIGSLVRIPQGPVDLVATVTQVGIAGLVAPLEPTATTQTDDRWLEVQLLGAIERGTQRFERGVGVYPDLEDSVHFTTPQELAAVFPPPGEDHLRLGCLAAAEEIPACVDTSRFVVRHSAVVGSTGSGKTSAVASILQGFVRGGWQASNILVIDPHGEYGPAVEGKATIRSVLATGDDALQVPFWALPASDILRIFAGASGSATFSTRYTELVTAARRSFVETANWLTLDPAAVTADTPIPFDIRSVWHELDAENHETLEVVGDRSTVCRTSAGDPKTLRPAIHKPYSAGNQAPFKGPFHGMHGTMPDLLRLGLSNPQLRFLLHPEGDSDGVDPLVNTVQSWLGHSAPVSVLNFSGVPARAADVAIGVVLNLVFEVAVRCATDAAGIGRPSPVLIVLEEAHRYLGDEAAKLTRDSANRIAREGRKYGVGLLLVSQRPTELPDTALAQCGTLVALRLSNSSDQGVVRAALPDSIAGLASILPSLRTGEGVVSGEAMVLPARVLLDRPDPRPLADDPSLDPWRDQPVVPDVSAALAAWRGTYEVQHD